MMLFKFMAPSPFRFIYAMARLAWARLRGYETLATTEEAEARLENCYDCPFFSEKGQCLHCGCFVEAKALLLTEQCPIKKWLRVWRKKARKKA